MVADPVYQLSVNLVRGRAYCETTRNGIKADMDLMNEIGGL
jgi:hypothetical protein